VVIFFAQHCFVSTSVLQDSVASCCLRCNRPVDVLLFLCGGNQEPPREEVLSLASHCKVLL
jgi:hypothetical protein